MQKERVRVELMVGVELELEETEVRVKVDEVGEVGKAVGQAGAVDKQI